MHPCPTDHHFPDKRERKATRCIKVKIFWINRDPWKTTMCIKVLKVFNEKADPKSLKRTQHEKYKIEYIPIWNIQIKVNNNSYWIYLYFSMRPRTKVKKAQVARLEQRKWDKILKKTNLQDWNKWNESWEEKTSKNYSGQHLRPYFFSRSWTKTKPFWGTSLVLPGTGSSLFDHPILKNVDHRIFQWKRKSTTYKKLGK